MCTSGLERAQTIPGAPTHGERKDAPPTKKQCREGHADSITGPACERIKYYIKTGLMDSGKKRQTVLIIGLWPIFLGKGLAPCQKESITRSSA